MLAVTENQTTMHQQQKRGALPIQALPHQQQKWGALPIQALLHQQQKRGALPIQALLPGSTYSYMFVCV